MKLLLATAYFDSHRGGIEIVAGRLAREFGAHGVAVTWLACDATAPVASASAQAGIEYRAVAIPAWNITERRIGVPLPLPGLRAMATILREVKAADSVMLHDSLYPTNVTAMLAARWHRKPVVLVQHIAVVPYENPMLRGLMRAANALITRPMLAAADQVVFISETVSRHFAGLHFKAPPQLIFNGVDAGLFRVPSAGFDRTQACATFGLPTDRPVALFVGRFVEKKGLGIIERLARRRPALTFALAGWGPIDPRAWRLPNVHVLTGLEGASLAPLYQASDVFVLPSVGEGLPLVLQEALACGLPVLCGADTSTADPSAATLIEGVAIDPSQLERTADAFASRIDQTLAQITPENRNGVAATRHAFVREHYGWSRAAERYVGILRDLVTTSRMASAGPPASGSPERTPS